MEVTRLFDIPYFQLEKFPQDDSLAAKVDGKWVKTSTKSFVDQAMMVSKALVEAGIKPNDKVSMISNNRPEWNIVDVGIQMSGAISVPIYPTISPKDYEYILNDAEVKICFVSSTDLLDKVNEVKDNVPSLRLIVSFEKINGTEHFSDFKARGEKTSTEDIESRKAAIKASDLATLIYTSGTTGNPKGVMLSHNNIVSNVIGSRERIPCDENAKAVSFLPLCHVYERMVLYLLMYTGVSVYYAESMDTIGDNIREVQPQVFTAVPRLLEKVFDKIMTKGSELTGIKRSLFFWAVALAENWKPYGENGAWYEFKLGIANKLIFNKWREALGGNVEVIASGSAALQPRLASIFCAAQIPILEGYGLTETSPVASVNSFVDRGFMLGTTGRKLHNVEIKIAEDGEILIKGPNVMMGYYNQPELTRQVLSEDGWFSTGDIGTLVDGQYLKITDRKKEIFKTSGGKYVAPQPMENTYKSSRFIDQIMVIGENQKHPAALIVPDLDFCKDWCNRKGYNCQSQADLSTNEKLKQRIWEEIDKMNQGYGKFEQVKKIELCESAWAIDSGELTPSLKLKRKFIMAKYAHLVDKIYT
ncbi:long-chain fatty acid--CoA ligase [Salibacteraceae bacterium]|nr:long-chain fatty acid--CoA ligase [Salibacteraceae bacterium]MDB9709597.1 long-chain fatty acid--CoA ligase [Salibacteraceae bacterium]MDC1304192.1 long-chain fatty acid--CoA ligase [Salibacteraceae bacterium]